MNLFDFVRVSLFGISSLGATHILGCLRRFPLGFSAVLSAGAYTAACLRIYQNWPWAICIVVACAAGALICVIPALFDRCLEGDEYVVLSWMMAMACAEAIGLMKITGGQHSLIGIPPLLRGASGFTMSAILLMAVFGGATAVGWVFRRSYAYEESLLAGLNPHALSSAGRSPYRTSLHVHLIGGAIGGLAGAFWGSLYQTLHPSQFGLSESVVILLICLLGGQGEPAGVLVGLVAVFALPQALNFARVAPALAALSRYIGVSPPDATIVANSLNQAFLGVLLVATVVWCKRGITPSVSKALQHRKGSR